MSETKELPRDLPIDHDERFIIEIYRGLPQALKLLVFKILDQLRYTADMVKPI